MMDFRLQAFISVARNLNFTKAAKELYISQPAVSKHIQELESTYGVQLFEREGSRISLTAEGELFLKHAETIIENYRALLLDMNLLSGRFSGALRVGASTTIAQYILPEIIAKFINRYPEIRLTMLTGNSEQVEQALADHRIDIGLVENASHHIGFRYTHFADDELVVVTNDRNRVKEEVSLEEFRSFPLVLRESGSGTLEVIEKTLAAHNIKLSDMNVLLQMGSTEGIKLFLVNSPTAYAVISVAALSKELLGGILKVIEVDDLSMKREFNFVTVLGAQNDIADRFMQFVITKSYM